MQKNPLIIGLRSCGVLAKGVERGESWTGNLRKGEKAPHLSKKVA
jgi:hypothetical protein